MLIKGELHKDGVNVDRRLSRLQNFMTDATGSLVYALEQLTSNEEVHSDVIQQALQFLGNASIHMSVERRTKALARLNPGLKKKRLGYQYQKL